MNKKIKNYVDVLFGDIAKSRRAIELKEELLSNMNASMDEYLRQGYSENQAYSQVMANLGDVDELLKEVTTYESKPSTSKEKKVYALIQAVAIMLIILSVGLFPLLEGTVGDLVAISVFFTLIGIGVGLLVYNNISKGDDKTFDEDKESYKHENLISGLIMSVATLIFFIGGFVFNTWHNIWIVFIIGGILCEIVKTLMQIKEV